MKGNSKLYSNILDVFESMLPGFQKLNLLNANINTLLQVVIKAQRYEIKPGMSYSGKWHIEGKTEKIVAAGVYYCNIDKGFKEDKLVFRNAEMPDPCDGELINVNNDYEIDVEDGSAVVFSNTLPHRFKELVNTTDNVITRTFINFFIIDPTKPLYCESQRMEDWKILKAKKLKKLFIEYILSFLYIKSFPFDIAKPRKKENK